MRQFAILSTPERERREERAEAKRSMVRRSSYANPGVTAWAAEGDQRQQQRVRKGSIVKVR